MWIVIVILEDHWCGLDKIHDGGQCSKIKISDRTHVCHCNHGPFFISPAGFCGFTPHTPLFSTLASSHTCLIDHWLIWTCFRSILWQVYRGCRLVSPRLANAQWGRPSEYLLSVKQQKWPLKRASESSSAVSYPLFCEHKRICLRWISNILTVASLTKSNYCSVALFGISLNHKARTLP